MLFWSKHMNLYNASYLNLQLNVWNLYVIIQQLIDFHLGTDPIRKLRTTQMLLVPVGLGREPQVKTSEEHYKRR